MSEEQNPIQTISAELSSPADLLKKSFALYKSGFKKLVGMMFVPLLGVLPLVVVLMLFGLFNFVLKNNDIARNIINVILGLAGIASVIVFMVVMLVSQAGLYILIRDASKNLTIKQAFMEAKKIAWKFIIVNLAAGVFTLLWGLLLIMPGIWAAINYSFALWVFLYEDFKGTAALKRSKELVKGNWWGIFWRLLVVYILFWVVLAVPAYVIAALTDSEFINGAWGIISNIISFLFTPLTLIYSCYLYWDLKGIKGESKIENKDGGKAGIIIAGIIIIIIFLGLFSTLAVVSLNNARQQSRDARRVSSVKQIQTGLELYFSDNNKYPESLEELKNIKPPLTNNELEDPLNKQPYKYKKDAGDNYEICFNLENSLVGFVKGENCVSREQ